MLSIDERQGYRVLNLQGIMYINTSVKWWAAEIKGLHPKFKFVREFLEGFLRDSKRRKEPYIPIDKIPFDVPIEVVGGSWKNQNRKYIIIRKVDREFIYYEELSEGEVVEMFKVFDEKEEARKLIKKALELVTKEELIELIKEI